MAQWVVKTLVTKPDYPSSIPRTHIVDRNNSCKLSYEVYTGTVTMLPNTSINQSINKHKRVTQRLHLPRRTENNTMVSSDFRIGKSTHSNVEVKRVQIRAGLY